MLRSIQDLYHNPFKTWFLVLLLIVNILGSIWGYIWYQGQLMATPYKYWLFVPDCPFATTLMALVLILWLTGRNNSYIELITFTALIKYGTWTVFVLSLDGLTGGQFDLETWLLFFSHIGMVIQGLFFIRFAKIHLANVVLIIVWFALNDFFDYGIGVYPYLPNPDHLGIIRAFTITWSLLLAVILLRKRVKLIY